jgi:hypothetical protein
MILVSKKGVNPTTRLAMLGENKGRTTSNGNTSRHEDEMTTKTFGYRCNTSSNICKQMGSNLKRFSLPTGMSNFFSGTRTPSISRNIHIIGKAV